MIEIVVNFDEASGEYQLYENTSQTLILSKTLGEGFSNLNGFLLTSGQIKKSLLEDDDIRFHFDAHTFREIIKSNMALLKRVSSIPSEFKNSANKFGTSLSKEDKPDFSKGSKNFQRKRMTGFKGSNFGKSFEKFSKKL